MATGLSLDGGVQRAIYGEALTAIGSLSDPVRQALVNALDAAVADIVRIRTARAGAAPPAAAPLEAAAAWVNERLRGLSTLEQVEVCRRGLIGLNHLVDVDQREQVAAIMIGAVSRHANAGSPGDGKAAAAVAEALRSEGYSRFDKLLDPQAAGAARSFLEAKPCYNAHIASMSDNFARRIGAGAEAFHYGAHSLSDIVRAPGLVEIANDPRLIEAAERYLGCVPTLYSLNAWWSFPNAKGPARYSQSFHRDRDDFRFCTLFVYLTDVGSGNEGPHVYVRRTHRRDLIEHRLAEVGETETAGLTAEDRGLIEAKALSTIEGYGSDGIVQALFGAQTDTILGDAGTAILADTFGFHKGIPPTTRPRLMFWARYGTYPNFSPATQRVPWTMIEGRLPGDMRTRYVNRALFSD